MEGAVFVGRPRPLWKVILYGVLTFGVYGRVLVYKSLKEIDGHNVYFLNLPLYRLGLILPVLGPLFVEFRLLHYLKLLLHADVTARPVRSAGLKWAALVPWFPVFHVLVQRHLNAYWIRQRKFQDIAARKEVLEDRRKKARSKAAQEEVVRMEVEIRERERGLAEAEKAAIAIREARRARRRADAERRAAGGSRRWWSPLGLLRRLRSRRPEVPAAPEAPSSATEAPDRRRLLPWKRRAPAETGEASPAAAPGQEGRGLSWRMRRERKKDEKRQRKETKAREQEESRSAKPAKEEPGGKPEGDSSAAKADEAEPRRKRRPFLGLVRRRGDSGSDAEAPPEEAPAEPPSAAVPRGPKATSRNKSKSK